MQKYLKPKSLTWWAGMLAITTGGILMVAGEKVEGMAFINGGLIAIGLRAAGGAQ